MLLVLDNCEHLLDDVTRLAETILRDCAGVRVLASSREGLAVRGEHIVAVRSLPMADADAEYAAIAQSAAVALDYDEVVHEIGMRFERALEGS